MSNYVNDNASIHIVPVYFDTRFGGRHCSGIIRRDLRNFVEELIFSLVRYFTVLDGEIECLLICRNGMLLDHAAVVFQAIPQLH